MATVGVVLLLLLLAPFLAAADMLCDNLKATLVTLPNNTSSSPVRFATAAFGRAPDIVYAFTICRGDIVGVISNQSYCRECVSNMTDKVLNAAPQQCYNGTYHDYGDRCILVYSTDDIIAPPSGENGGDDTPVERWNDKNITGDADEVRLITGLIRELLVQTVEKAASAAPMRFATGIMDSGTTFPMVRSLAQCRPDASTVDCLACLRRLLGVVNATMSLRMGAQINAIRCYFRYEAYRFYGGEATLRLTPPPAPSLAPTPAKRKSKAGEEELGWQGKNSEFSMFEFEQVLVATNNFSEENKLGECGFGTVYKGQLPEGSEIALKRLAPHSGQDENKRALLDWSTLLAIIQGIAHGLLYLHKHSQLRVIHRDLKPSNILLDSEMNPKISDFGLAKIFNSNSIEQNTTRRVFGTYGYMPPEYASEGIFSIKSDVFSFGVVIFEIISGKRNSGSRQCGDFINLLGYAWQLWKEGRLIDLADASLVSKSNPIEMMRCINIALLCVQDNASDRPTMADVVAMLSNQRMIMAEPKQPAYFNVRVENHGASCAPESCSINDITISVTVPR
ncbi:putative receptor-like protein kinase At4g00960 [Triticum dicoccoides]|uniref:putative receptor-like protein kinase At4g00960 n=1 Tax=Triticum dicoccoides TaxID=85692 RepID=UPI00188FA019|nr:putative receptor-like protein kinase At4g00960 [Triticum dicoccoides]